MKNHILAILAIALVGLGFLAAWEIYRPKPAKAEPPAAAVRQKDGSLELERAPSGLATGAPAGSRPLKPAQELPKGAKVERLEEVTVDPYPQGAGDPGRTTSSVAAGIGTSLNLAPSASPGAPGSRACPPVTVDLSLVRMPDQTRRVLASSPNGQVVGGLDVPVDPPAPLRVQRWTAAALAGYDTHAGRNVFGGQVSYSKGPFVVSAGVVGGTGFIGAGIHF